MALPIALLDMNPLGCLPYYISDNIKLLSLRLIRGELPMQFEQLVEQFTRAITKGTFIQATISQPRKKSDDLKRIRLKPIELAGKLHIQFEYQYERVLHHENRTLDTLKESITQALENFRQVHAQFTEENVHVQLSKKFKVVWKTEKSATTKTVDLSHNRKKQYILDPTQAYPFLVHLGLQTKDGKVKNKAQQKFRQINRFLEFIEDSLSHLPTDRTIRIIDFGSGKSYLTFALYHYLRIEKGLNVNITGLDLKKEVIEACRQIAAHLQYEDLEFLVGDINEYNEETAVDMVITLHACDIATDMALARAVKWGAKVILSVPCCQHELASQIDAPALDLMLQHGLMKERFSSLATDTIRAELLQLLGYDTQLLEFIDMENTPKNVLIRAYHSGKKANKEKITAYKQFRDLLGAKPYLEKELANKLSL